MTRLRHLTLTTGHVRWSDRSEISAEAVAVGRRLVEQLADQPDQPTPILPQLAGYALSGSVNSDVLTAQVLGPDGPLVDLVCSAIEPSVEVTIKPQLAFDMAAGDCLGDFERCLGWAFYEWRRDL